MRDRGIRWWQVWRYGELKRQNEENLATLVRERPDFTAADARFLVSLCRSGRRTPDWLVEKMVGGKNAS